MGKILEVKNLNSCGFTNFSINFDKKGFYTILGCNGSGKTNLLKCIYNFDRYNIDLFFNGRKMKKSDLSKIGFLFEYYEVFFTRRTLMEELNLQLNGISENQKEKIIEQVCDNLDIKELLNCPIVHLSAGEKQIVAFVREIIKEPEILFIDESFSMVDSCMKNKIFSYLKKMNENNNLTVVHITHNVEDVFYGKSIIVFADNTVVANGKVNEVLLQENIFKKYNLQLPFIVDLSNKLKYYDLIDDVVFDENELIDLIWN